MIQLHYIYILQYTSKEKELLTRVSHIRVLPIYSIHNKYNTLMYNILKRNCREIYLQIMEIQMHAKMDKKDKEREVQQILQQNKCRFEQILKDSGKNT